MNRPCDACGRMRDDVQRVALMVEGTVRVERELCYACLTETCDRVLSANGFPSDRRAFVAPTGARGSAA